MSVVRTLIEDFCATKANVITQINVRKTSDMEIRFGNDEEVKNFLLEKGLYAVRQFNDSVGKKVI